MKGRKTGGRQKGTCNKKTREIADKAASEGITPLELLVREMRTIDAELATLRSDPNADPMLVVAKVKEMRELAKDTAPYIHPRLQSTTVTGSLTHRRDAAGELSDAELERIAAKAPKRVRLASVSKLPLLEAKPEAG